VPPKLRWTTCRLSATTTQMWPVPCVWPLASTRTSIHAHVRRGERVSKHRVDDRLRETRCSCFQAVLEGDWRPLLRIRQEQGRSNVAAAVPVEEIVEIFSSFKELLVPRLVGAFAADPSRLIAALQATDRYVRFSFATVLEAYVCPSKHPVQPVELARRFVS
jgi:hypothetical protein